ncbi:MAG: N-acetyltransferase [Defluviitaleaceae bacterium]|nr:N-acetyltransferase [Defluviitaleaceae bacterium]
MILRLERPEDHYAVESLTRAAFWKSNWSSEPRICDEHLLVHRLRKCPSYVPELNYVAEIDGKIVGHIIYTKSKIVDTSGKEYEMLTFGPLSAMPEYQGNGIGKALMLHTFEVARDLGYRAVIIFGHPDYYPRVGFRRAAAFGITTPDSKTFDPFMVLPLYNGALDGITGRYYIDPVYETLTEKDTLAFDKKFPPKELHKPILMDMLLGHLEPAAQQAIQSLKLETLAQMQTKSQRDISSLDGVNENAIEIIRTIMVENGLRWGK